MRSPDANDRHAFYCIHSSSWVNVVAVTPNDEIVMVRQFRHGSREVTLELPGGMVDRGESPSDAASRELLEETGYGVEGLAPLCELNPNPALFENTLYTYVGRDAAIVAEISNPGMEETVVELVPWGQLMEHVRTGVVDHALIVAALFHYDLRLRG